MQGSVRMVMLWPEHAELAGVAHKGRADPWMGYYKADQRRLGLAPAEAIRVPLPELSPAAWRATAVTHQLGLEGRWNCSAHRGSDDYTAAAHTSRTGHVLSRHTCGGGNEEGQGEAVEKERRKRLSRGVGARYG